MNVNDLPKINKQVAERKGLQFTPSKQKEQKLLMYVQIGLFN